MNFDELKEFMIGAHNRFYDLVPICAKDYPGLSSFDIVDKCNGIQNQLVWGMQVKELLREGVNYLNAWGGQLHIWGIWLKVLSEYDDAGQWEVEANVVDPIAYFCMMQPATAYDRFIEITEPLLHQAKLLCVSEYKDILIQDSYQLRARVSTEARLDQLDKLGQSWKSYKKFKNLFRQIDGKDYRNATFNYRNSAQHSLPNRLGRGIITHVSRSLEPYEEIVLQPDGSYLTTQHSSKRVVSYEFGELNPLDMEKARLENLKQYQLSRKSMSALEQVVEEVVSTYRQKHNRNG